MGKSLDWRKHVDSEGNFELPSFLYFLLTDLMKQTLDLGTLLSNDGPKTRAYKEQIKKIFKDRWNSVAQALEYFEIIVPCGCGDNYCTICGGSRYLLNSALSPNVMREISYFKTANAGPGIDQKLHEGLVQAIKTVEEHYGD